MFFRPRRRPSTMQASIRFGVREMTVNVLDVSEVGVRLGAGAGSVSAGQSVTVVTPRLQLTGSVVWAKGGEIGVKLDRKLSPSQMTELSGISWGI